MNESKARGDKRTAPEITVDREELTKALRSVVRLIKPSNKAQALIGFADELLSIELPGLCAGVRASGVWPGTARCSAAFLVGLARIPLDTTVVTFRVENGRLSAGPSSITCEWEDDRPAGIQLPLNADLRRVLSVAYHYTSGEIEKAGLTSTVSEATAKRDTRLRQAVRALQDFGVTASDLQGLVDRRMKEMLKP